MNKNNIKSMKLYNNVNRIFNEFKELGIDNTNKIKIDEICKLDQLHYCGTEALDFAIKKLGINSKMSILEIGSGLGGPARYIANKTGAIITAIELQKDHNQIAKYITKKCGLSDNVKHICKDILKFDSKKNKYDLLVSWLSLFHIKDNDLLLKKCNNLLKKNGIFYTEDIIKKRKLTKEENSVLASELFASNLLEYDKYMLRIKENKFKIILDQEMTNDWLKFTKERKNHYNNNKNRNIRVHGIEVYESMNFFYSFIDSYFTNKIIGGIRIEAKKIN